jgi:hypothetical protein
MNVSDRLLLFAIDHVRAEKHGGETIAANLCLSCFRCNGFKGSDIASADPLTGLATFLYNPREQQWDDHFSLDGALIKPLTPEGRITTFLLRLNAPIQVEQRTVLIADGRYPCATTE